MSATLLLADLHLDAARPRLVALFEALLGSLDATRVDRLYILGDLVEAWIGDDDDAPLVARIARATRGVVARGVPVFFMRGNRDFLLGPAFAHRAGFTLIEEDAVVHVIQGRPTLLMHGDTLCTDDVRYQAVRREVRTAAWQRKVLALSLAERRALAAASRAESRDHTGNTAAAIMDVNAAAVAEAMRSAGVTRLIHGHTHRPAIHNFHLDDATPAQRIVLGDWYTEGSVLRVTGDDFALRNFVRT